MTIDADVLQSRIDRADEALATALDVITGWCRPDLWGDLPTIEKLCYEALDILREQDELTGD